MGYGGGDAEMGRVTGRSGDEGIDGTIQEDVLGLDEVFVQAKRYSDGITVGKVTCATSRARSTLLVRPRACSLLRRDSRALRKNM